MKDALALTAATMLLLVSGVVLPGTAAAGERCEITDLIAYSVEDALESRVEAFPSCDGGPAPEAAPRVPEPVTYETAQAPDVHEYGGYTVQTVEAPKGRFYGGIGAGWTELQPIDQGKFHAEFLDQWSASLIPVGYQWSNGFGLELDATYRRYGVEGGLPAAVSVLTISGCGLYEMDTALTFDPFVRGCVGSGVIGVDPSGKDAIAGFNLADHGYSWEAGGGVQFPVTEGGRIRARLAYAYGGVDGVSLTGVDHMDAPRHHTAGLTVLVGY